MPPSGLPEILVLTHRIPHPPDKGDRIRTYHILRWLSTRARVSLACLADEPFARESVDTLESLCERVEEVVPLGTSSRWLRVIASLGRGRTATEGAFHSPKLERLLRRWTSLIRFDLAIASSSALVPYLLNPGLHGIPAVIDMVDVDSQKWLDYAARTGLLRRSLYSIEGERLRRLECDLAGWAKAVILVSDAEAELYRRFSPASNVFIVPNGVDLDYYHSASRTTEGALDCIFVGALDYFPNVEGVCHFCREIWPRIRGRCRAARMVFVGRRPVPAVRQLAEIPGVVVVGQVADVRPYLADAAVVVVPLRLARGVQNKVLEAMAMGKATVASPQSLAGLRSRNAASVRVASTPQEWEGAILPLLGDSALRQRIGADGRRFVERHHRWDRCLGPLSTILGLPGEPGEAPLREPSPAQPAARR